MSNFLPNDLILGLKKDPEFDIDAFERVHKSQKRISTIRLNPAKKLDTSRFDIKESIPWCADGLVLKERFQYTLDPLFHAGAYYPQEASSMFLSEVYEQIFDQDEPVKILDLCAAPGGKSTLLLGQMSQNSLLVSNEIIKSRSHILEQNIVKWGQPNCIVTNSDPSSFERLPGYFDLLVVDAPCSGSGMIRKDHAVLDQWSENSVQLCAERQRRILADSIPCIAKDGYLFYSTCSYSEEENEQIVDWLIDTFHLEPVALPILDEWGITKSNSSIANAECYRFYPHKTIGEGFFCSLLQKIEPQATFNRKKLKQEKNNAPMHVSADWIDDTGLTSFLYHDVLHVFPDFYKQDLTAIQNVIYLKNAGTRLGKWTGKELIPRHDLALSSRVSCDLPVAPLNRDEALAYLRKDNVDFLIEKNLKNGWLLAQYEGINLGWIKALGSRVNNYYPKESRIVSL